MIVCFDQPRFYRLLSGFTIDSVGDRQRDILPLPYLPSPGVVRENVPRKVWARISETERWTSWANEGIDALNSMVGHLAGSGKRDPANATQVSSLAHIRQAYQGLCQCAPDEVENPAEALRALLAKSSSYNDATTRRPPVQDNVSLPAEGCVPTPLADILHLSDLLRHGVGSSAILRPVDEAWRCSEN